MGHHLRFPAYALTIATVYMSFLATVAKANNVCFAKQDQTLEAQSSGTKVVETIIEKIQESGIFPNDNQFLRRIAYVESKDGTDPNTYSTGYYGGIWQVDEIGFQATQDISSHPGLVAKFAKIQQHFGIDWTTVTWQDLEKPFYSGLAVRLFLSNIPEAIPLSSEIEKQAEYWKEYYNMEAENATGTAQKFIDDVSKLNDMTNEECKHKKSDVIFVLDSSWSIGPVNFEEIKNFVVNVIKQFTIGPQDTQVGVIVFSTGAIVEFSLNTYNTSEDIIAATQAISYSEGGTDTASGLYLLVQEYASNSRPASQGVPKIAIVVTDGKSDNNAETVFAAQNVHANDIITYAVGIGDNVNQQELSEIASSKGTVGNIGGFNGTELESLQSNINLKACKAPAISEIEAFISSTIEKDEEAYYQYEFPKEGITLKLTAEEGSVVMYASDKTSNPSEALYDVRAETSCYTDVYINYNTLYGQCLSERKKCQTVTAPYISNIILYITVVGQFNTSNIFTLDTTYRDTSIPTQATEISSSPTTTTPEPIATTINIGLVIVVAIASGVVGGILALLVIIGIVGCCIYYFYIKRRAQKVLVDCYKK